MQGVLAPLGSYCVGGLSALDTPYEILAAAAGAAAEMGAQPVTVLES